MIDHITLGTHKATGHPNSPTTESFLEHEICSAKRRQSLDRPGWLTSYISIQTETKKGDSVWGGSKGVMNRIRKQSFPRKNVLLLNPVAKLGYYSLTTDASSISSVRCLHFLLLNLPPIKDFQTFN